MMWRIYEMIHIWTAVVDESEEWSSQLIFQVKQLERRSLKKKSGLRVFRAYVHDVMAAILVFQNFETADMFVYQTNPVGV